MTVPLIALTLQPDEEPVVLPSNPLSQGDTVLFVAFILIVAIVFGIDMVRTWWETNQWKRDARRRRRDQR